MRATFILSAGADVCGASHVCLGSLGFSHLGETGEGFVLCFALQSRHVHQKPFDYAHGRHRHRSTGHERLEILMALQVDETDKHGQVWVYKLPTNIIPFR